MSEKRKSEATKEEAPKSKAPRGEAAAAAVGPAKEAAAPAAPAAAPTTAPAAAASPQPTKPAAKARARPFGKGNAIMTITYGDCAENHVGMQKLGEAASEGVSCAELAEAKRKFEELGCTCELIDLVAAGEAQDLSPAPEEASILIVRGGVAAVLGGPERTEDLLHEQLVLEWDSKALMKGRVVNKHARHNLCYAPEGQPPNYEEGKGRVVAFSAVPQTQRMRELIPRFFGAKTRDLYAEGNLYFDPSVCGIGFHGDAERRIVVALRLGGSMPLHYQWFQRSVPVGVRVKLTLQHGDLYAMSAKAVGHDWLKKTIPTLRHAAGAAKFLTIKK